MGGRTDEFADILYGLNAAKPHEICGMLLNMYRQNFPDARCIAPAT